MNGTLISNFADRLNLTLEIKNITPAELSRLSKINEATISNYRKGKYKPKRPNLELIAKALNVSVAWLLGVDVPMEPFRQNQSTPLIEDKSTDNDLPAKAGGVPYNPTHRIPILGHISAGLPLYAEQHIEGYTYTDLNHGSEYFALRVKGDSMNAANIFEGNILIVRKQNNVENGEIAVVIVDSENATVKRFYQKGDIVTLSPQSLNPKHLPQIYDLKQVPIRIIGKVVRNQIDFE